jgi:hypothetical protein
MGVVGILVVDSWKKYVLMPCRFYTTLTTPAFIVGSGKSVLW